jgi:hypothetical protein
MASWRTGTAGGGRSGHHATGTAGPRIMQRRVAEDAVAGRRSIDHGPDLSRQVAAMPRDGN